ncbi:MAG: hypothetical protein HQK63_03420 [Desulfamplus sp.]|nr:hypothetical protein [Desulfamplus sp.]
MSENGSILLSIDSEIHANYVEAQNAATRRRNSTFRRKTNTYAKTKEDCSCK